MPESASDLIGILMGLAALWFLVGSLVRHERLWEGQRRRRPWRRPLTARTHGTRPINR